MSDISLLPDQYREKEEELKKSLAEPVKAEPGMSMHLPDKEAEDVEIIEVDENEVDQMLQNEPFYSRLYYKLGVLGDGLKKKLFAPCEVEPPPKLPPQFFTPPKPKQTTPNPQPSTPNAVKPIEISNVQASRAQEAPKIATPAPALAIKPKITPASQGKRVRIIKRVRKPVHVSLLNEQMVRDLQVNVSKRKFTLAFLTIIFVVIFAGAYVLLDRLIENSNTELMAVSASDAQIKGQILEQQAKWAAFQDLEPRLIVLNDLLNKHVSVSKLFSFLEQNTLKDVSYGNLALDESGKLSLSVLAADLPSAARQLMIFKESPEVNLVDANTFSILTDKNKTGVSFQLIVQLKSEALRFLSEAQPNTQ